MAITGVVILYHPDVILLKENIKTYIQPLDKLLVYDNSEQFDLQLETAICSISDKIVFKHFGKNEGIAKRLNQAIELTLQSASEYLLMMDQDSSFKDGDFEKYLDLINNNKEEKVGQFGVNCQPEFTPIHSIPEHAVSLITSGSVLQLKFIKEIGMFDENLFIDFVDTEFSYRVTNNGYHNLLCSSIVLNHSIGTRVEGRSLVTFKKSMRIIHSPIRVYYILRNAFYLLHKYKGLSAIQRKDINRSVKIVKNDFIYNPQIASVYLNAIVAIKDFLFNKMGKK